MRPCLGLDVGFVGEEGDSAIVSDSEDIDELPIGNGGGNRRADGKRAFVGRGSIAGGKGMKGINLRGADVIDRGFEVVGAPIVLGFEVANREAGRAHAAKGGSGRVKARAGGFELILDARHPREESGEFLKWVVGSIGDDDNALRIPSCDAELDIREQAHALSIDFIDDLNALGGRNATGIGVGRSDVANEGRGFEFLRREAAELGGVLEGFVGDDVDGVAVDFPNVAIFEFALLGIVGNSALLQDVIGVVRAADGKDSSREEGRTIGDFEHVDTGFRVEDVDAVLLIALVKKGVRFDKALENEFVRDVARRDDLHVDFIASGVSAIDGKEFARGGRAIDDGGKAVGEEFDLLCDKIGGDHVLARSRNENGVIDGLEKLDAHGFRFGVVLVRGVGSAVFVRALHTGLELNGFDAVNEHLRRSNAVIFADPIIVDAPIVFFD